MPPDHNPGMKKCFTFRQCKAQHIFHLTGGDQNGGAGREAYHNGMGDKIDQFSQTGQPKHQLIDASQESDGQRQ